MRPEKAPKRALSSGNNGSPFAADWGIAARRFVRRNAVTQRAADAQAIRNHSEHILRKERRRRDSARHLECAGVKRLQIPVTGSKVNAGA